MPAENRQPWDQQPWDTDVSFKAFLLYLELDPPRSVNEAYRVYAGVRKGTAKDAPNFFRFWAQAKKRNGHLIEGALSWEARAAAWDDHLAQQRVRQREKEHLAEIEEYRATMSRLSRANLSNALQIISIVNKTLETDLQALRDNKADGLTRRQLPAWIRAANDAIDKTSTAWAQSLGLEELLRLLTDEDSNSNP